jgi:hypothetical protein
MGSTERTGRPAALRGHLRSQGHGCFKVLLHCAVLHGLALVLCALVVAAGHGPAQAQTIACAGTENPATTSSVVFDAAAQTCNIVNSNVGAVAVGSLRLTLAPTANPDIIAAGATPILNTASANLNLFTTCSGPIATAALTCEFQANPLPSGTYVIANDSSGPLITMTVQVVASLNSLNVISATITIAATTPGPQAVSQQQLGSEVMLREAGRNVGEGTQNAVADRFFEEDGSQGSFDDTSGAAYVSLRGMRMAARDRLKRRIEIANGTYVAPRVGIGAGLGAGTGAGIDRDAQNAIATAFPDAAPVNDGSSDAGSNGLLSYDDLTDPLLMAETSRWNVWVRGSFTHFDGDAFSGNTWNGISGLDYRYTANIIIGALAGYESGDFDFDATNGAFEGTGFTTGAYVGVRLADNLVMDAFLTHTWLDYDNRAGTATGETDATRLMVSVNVSGRYQMTDSLIFEPNARVFYAHEDQDAYALSSGTAIAANSIDSGRLSLGPKLRYLLPDTSNGNWSVFVSTHGEFDFSSEVQTSSALPDFDDLVTARIGFGLDGTLLNGWMVSLAGDLGGLGSGSFVSYTGTGKVRVPLN